MMLLYKLDSISLSNLADKGETWLDKEINNVPSFFIKYLWKFHLGKNLEPKLFSTIIIKIMFIFS